MDMKEIPIEKLGLSMRAYHRLRRAEICTVGDLMEQTEESLAAIPSLGEKSLAEVLDKRAECMAKLERGEGVEAFLVSMNDPEVQKQMRQRLQDMAVKVDVLELLPPKVFNILLLSGYEYLHQLAFVPQQKLMEIPRMDAPGAEMIERYTMQYMQEHAEILRPVEPKAEGPRTVADLLGLPQFRELLLEFVRANDLDIDTMKLSNRPKNQLRNHGYYKLSQIILLPPHELKALPAMGAKSVQEIQDAIGCYIDQHEQRIWDFCHGEATALEAQTSGTGVSREKPLTVKQLLGMSQFREPVLEFVRANDLDIATMPLGSRAKNSLSRAGYCKLSEFILMTPNEWKALPAMGAKSVQEIQEVVTDYLRQYEQQMLAFCNGDRSVLISDARIGRSILNLYKQVPFQGLNLAEMTAGLDLGENLSQERLKKIIGGLIAGGELEYVDFRCYCRYGSFGDFLNRCTALDERNHQIFKMRLEGMTLEQIGQAYNIQRERVRQILHSDIQKITTQYAMTTGRLWFDEDYYRYLYETYEFDRTEITPWLGVSPSVWNYMDILGARQGKKPLEDALSDHKLDTALRLRIKNYLHRNQVCVDGIWVEKKQSELEMLVIRKFCQEDTNFYDLPGIYNRFIEALEIPYDPELYYTQERMGYKKNRLSEARYLLWKQNSRIRYYDIDSRDYTELLDALQLDAYENVEYSTEKFVRDYPEIMEKYDIRDCYELHNLLRKIVPEGAYHGFQCLRTPHIGFGNFDRDGAILELIVDNAPISIGQLSELVSQEYGYDPVSVRAMYLKPFDAYVHQGMYIIDQKQMPTDRQAKLKAVLTGDFYYIDEIRKTYRQLFPHADPEEVNAYNLKSMGFTVLSKYVLQNYTSLEECFEHLFTASDIVDLNMIRRKYVNIQMYYLTLKKLKRRGDVIEFEPNKLLNIRKLEQAGVTRQMLQEFRDAVWDFVPHGDYFNATSLQADGFQSELYDLGFSDYFYSSLLAADERFSSTNVFNAKMLCRGKQDISIQSMLVHCVQKHGCVDVLDLLTELKERFGCTPPEKGEIVYRLKDTGVYYDRILERLYADEETYYQDLEKGGVF